MNILVSTFFPQFNQDLQVFEFQVSGFPALNNFLQRRPLFENLLSLVALVPENRIGYFGL